MVVVTLVADLMHVINLGLMQWSLGGAMKMLLEKNEWAVVCNTFVQCRAVFSFYVLDQMMLPFGKRIDVLVICVDRRQWWLLCQ